MPIRRRTQVQRRTAAQVGADTAARELAKALGAALRDACAATGRSQRAAADIAGMAHSTVAEAEKGNGDDFTLRTWARLGAASRVGLHAYLKGASAADRPRDSVHLRVQELLLEASALGGWRGTVEFPIDDATRGTRSVDGALERPGPDGWDVAILEVVDWLDDAGAAFRDWTRRLARVDQLVTARRSRDDGEGHTTLPRVAGCWVLRATQRNRGLVRDHGRVFHSCFPGPGTDWLRALRGSTPMPVVSALLWVSVDGTRLWPARL
jgi:hypothetical protein